MGAYLTVPNTEKASNDSANEFMEIGASSMQGWRISQEDAHNCLLDFDTNTSLFSVYDGHGGSEVALYCAAKLPAFLKQLQAYKDGDFELALKDTFLGFDKTLLDEDVIEELKRLAEKNPDRENEGADDDEEEDLTELCQEGALPLHQVLEKYKGCVAAKYPQLLEIKQGGAGGSGSGSSTSKPPLSPFRSRSRRANNKDVASKEGDGPSSSTTAKVCSMPDLGAGDACVSSTCSKIDPAPNEAVCVSGSNGVDSGASKNTDGDGDVDSSSAEVEVKKKVQNGDITSSSSSGTPSPASGSASGNGEVSSNSTVAKVTSSPGKVIAAEAKPSTGNNGSSGISSSTSKVASAAVVVGSSPSGKGRVQPAGDMDDSSSDDDADFHAEEENSSTEDGEEDCGAFDDETDDDDNDEAEDEETDDDEEGLLDDEDTAFCRNMIEEPGKDSGCTAVVAVINGRDLYVGNAGDSRCVVSRNGKAIEMSLDHKPEDEVESDRIQKAGGKVTLDGRVNGGLNLSRAIGDHAYKMNHEIAAEKQMISALPDVRKLVITPADEFMILACDGIWNFMSSDEVVEFVKKRFDEGCDKLSQICEELFDHCLAPNTMGDGTGCDNMTAVLVRFKPALQNLPTKISTESEATATIATAAAAVTAAATTKKATASVTPSRNSDDDSNSLEKESSSTDGVERPSSAAAAAKKRPASPSRSSSSDDDDDMAITSGNAATAVVVAAASSDRENASKRLKTDNEAVATDSQASSHDEDVTMSAVTTSSTESTSTVVTTAMESESTTSSTTTSSTT